MLVPLEHHEALSDSANLLTPKEEPTAPATAAVKREPLAAGQKVAAYVPYTKRRSDWILAEIVSYDTATSKYTVRDLYPDRKRKVFEWSVDPHQVVQFPPATVEVFDKDERVLSLWWMSDQKSWTSTFYEATITRRSEASDANLHLVFDKGSTSPVKYPRSKVVRLPKQPRNRRNLSSGSPDSPPKKVQRLARTGSKSTATTSGLKSETGTTAPTTPGAPGSATSGSPTAAAATAGSTASSTAAAASQGTDASTTGVTDDGPNAAGGSDELNLASTTATDTAEAAKQTRRRPRNDKAPATDPAAKRPRRNDSKTGATTSEASTSKDGNGPVETEYTSPAAIAARRLAVESQRIPTLEGATSFPSSQAELQVYSRSRDVTYSGVLAKKMQNLYHCWKENLKGGRSAFRPPA
jgi:hypothetical protein